MNVTVKLFGSFAEAAGWRVRTVEVPAGSTAGELLAQLRRGPLVALAGTGRPLLAVNREHVSRDRVLAEGDEVGLLPPVSGGATDDDTPALVITDAPLDARALADSVRHPSRGAVVTFEGIVRDFADGMEVEAIDYDAYPEMAAAVLRSIRDEIAERHPGVRLALAHRTGLLAVGEVSVVACAAAAHRRDAFAACRLAMDRIKESLPVWKKEHGRAGERRWR